MSSMFFRAIRALRPLSRNRGSKHFKGWSKKIPTHLATPLLSSADRLTAKERQQRGGDSLKLG
jgi:hypothetical protein